MNPQGMHGMMQAPMQQPVLFCPVQPIYMLHYAAFQDQHKTALACEEPALKKRRQQPRRQCEETLSTVSIPCTYEDLSDESSTEQNGEVPMKGSVVATVENYRKRNTNTRPEDIIDLFFPPITSPISQATHSRPPAPMFPRFLPHHAQLPTCPLARCDPHAHNSLIRHLRPSNPPTHQTTGLLDPSGCRPSRPSRCPEYGPVCPAAAASRAFSLRAANCHTSAPPVRHHWAGCPPPLLSLTMAPLGQPAPRPLLDCHGISKSRI